ncbi:MAG: UvrD-helicase domain-containing protein [Candidatus Magasanikbacteria bacterium]
MNQTAKQIYFKLAQEQLKRSLEVIRQTLQKTTDNVSKLKKSLHTFNEDDKIVQSKLLEMNTEKQEELELMQDSPYFNKCEINNENIYIGKFSLSEEHIYSWVSPISKIRFEHPGNINYTLPDKTEKQGIMTKKDQYMIVGGKIIYLSTETLDNPRELIYQDYFSNQKKSFVLPEIVAQMEKAQDAVIRASYKNALLISGPAGSGKTTLALHRVAYLLQSPDVADKFHTSKILILVQDIGTKEYFSHLLPELGIKNVTIRTFADWAMSVLDLQNYNYQNHVDIVEEDRDYLEYYKLQSLQNFSEQKYSSNIFTLLEKVYQNLPSKYLEIIKYQKENKILDRIDLTILLQIFKKTHGNITIIQEYYQLKKRGASLKKIGRFPAFYDLIIFDEFQNYLPTQIKIIKSCLNPENNAVMYVGDMNQKTQLGTIADWSEINESLKEERKIFLNKVYRNSKQILEYIQKLGYKIIIPDNIKEGTQVIEKNFENIDEEIKYVKENLQTKVVTGILARNKKYLQQYKIEFKKEKNIHILSMDEIQGLEFDTVFLVGINKQDILSASKIELVNLKKEKEKIDRDLLYVALTRATNNLFVLGKDKLSDIF